MRLVCCSPAPHGASFGVAIAFLLESLESRESLTEDSRSAVKARLFDPLRESFGEERCTPGKADESFTQDPTERR